MLEHQHKGWRSFVTTVPATQPRHPRVFQTFDVSGVLDNPKQVHQAALLASNGSTVKMPSELVKVFDSP